MQIKCFIFRNSLPRVGHEDPSAADEELVCLLAAPLVEQSVRERREWMTTYLLCDSISRCQSADSCDVINRC